MGENITSFFLLAFWKEVHPPLQDRSLRRSSDFFCRHHLDWIGLRHSVLTKSSVLRLALASMRSGQPEAGHPRNLYRVGRASSSPAQATGWRHDGWHARPARRHGSRPRSVPTCWNQARGSAGGGSGLLEVPGRYARFHTDRKNVSHISPRAETTCPCVSENAREGGCRPNSSNHTLTLNTIGRAVTGI